MLKLQTIFSNKQLDLNDAISKSLEIIADMTNYTSVVLGSSAKDNTLKKYSPKKENISIEQKKAFFYVI